MNLQELVLWSGVTVSVSMFIITIILRVEDVVSQRVGVVMFTVAIVTVMFSILSAIYISYKVNRRR